MERHTAGDGTVTGQRRDAVTISLGLTAAAVQTLLLFGTNTLGLMWGGWSFLAAVGLVAVGLGLIAALTVLRRRSAVAVPFVSAAAVLALLFSGPNWRYFFGS